MPEPENQMNDIELRIMNELTFISDHILSLEKTLRELLPQLERQKKIDREPFRVP